MVLDIKDISRWGLKVKLYKVLGQALKIFKKKGVRKKQKTMVSQERKNMGTIKLDKDEMLKKASELSVLKDQINNILIKTQNTENVLRRETSVSTYSQKRKLSDMQDLAYNLVREFEKISDNFYAAARAYESTEEKLNNLVNINKDSNFGNIIAVNSMENTYFNSDNTKSKEKEETAFDKLRELTQAGWSFIKGYFELNISSIDFMKEVCDNINTFVD